jgi:hypothetical protein
VWDRAFDSVRPSQGRQPSNDDAGPGQSPWLWFPGIATDFQQFLPGHS